MDNIVEARLKLARAEKPIIGPDEMRESLTAFDRESARWNAVFRGVECHVTFIGYPRSGHSLVGALLDAHPQIVIAHELNALALLRAGLRRSQIFWLELQNSRAYAGIGRAWGEYSYAVEGQHQGAYEQLRVIGDKKGGASSRLLLEQPELLERAREVLGPAIRIVHVVRHPLDNIATLFIKHRMARLSDAIDYYFVLCKSNQAVARRAGSGEWLEIHNDDVLQDPRGQLALACGFLGIATSAEYLAACARTVVPGRGRTRHRVAWTRDDIARVRQESTGYPFLSRYDLNGP